MEFDSLKVRANVIQALYDKLNIQQGREQWARHEYVRGYVGDVGTLVKLTMAADGVRELPEYQEKLEHELADCFWSLLVISEKYGVDLEKAFLGTMDELEELIKSKLEG